MPTTKYSANEIKEFYRDYLFSHNYSKDVFLSKKENRQRRINKKKNGINFEFYLKKIFPQENLNQKMFGKRFSNDLIYQDEEGKYIFVNDGREPIIEDEETKFNPEFGRLYLFDLFDLFLNKETDLINLEEKTKRNIIKNTSNIQKRMKLLDPKIYFNTRKFFLSVES